MTKKKYRASKKGYWEKESFKKTLKFVEDYFPEKEKKIWLTKFEIYHLVNEGIILLEKKVEFLADNKLELIEKEGSEELISYFRKAVDLNPNILNLLDLANKIVEEKEDKKKALQNLNKIRSFMAKMLGEIAKIIRYDMDSYLLKKIKEESLEKQNK